MGKEKIKEEIEETKSDASKYFNFPESLSKNFDLRNSST